MGGYRGSSVPHWRALLSNPTMVAHRRSNLTRIVTQQGDEAAVSDNRQELPGLCEDLRLAQNGSLAGVRFVVGRVRDGLTCTAPQVESAPIP